MRFPALCVAIGLCVGATPALAQNLSNDRFAGPAPAGATKQVKKPHKAAKPVETKTEAKAAKSASKKPKAEPVKEAKVVPSPARITDQTSDKLATDSNADIPAAERAAIQAALSWAGDYANLPAGENPFAAAVKSFQKRNKAKITGVLTPAERTMLVEAAKRHEDEFGWRVVEDPNTGARLGLPTKMVPLTREGGTGSRWSSRHGDVQVETFKVAEPGTTLSAVFEQQKKARDIEYSSLNGDGFVVSGLQGLKRFITRAQIKDGEVRGLVMLFDQALEGIMAPLTTAMSSTFAAFPPQGIQLASVAPKKVEYSTATVVSAAGHLIAARNAVDGCSVIVAAGIGNAERVAEDGALALLRLYGAGKLTPIAFAKDAMRGNEASLIGIPEPRAQDGGKAVKTANAKLLTAGGAQFLQPGPVAGFSGGSALDRDGHLLGIIESRNAVVASAQGSAPPATLVPAETVRKFLAAQNVAVREGNSSPEDAKASVVRIICVRQ